LNFTRNLREIFKNLNVLRMKKVVTLCSIVCLALGAKAQTSFGPMLGLNLSNANTKVFGDKIDTKMKIGFHVGAIANIAIGDHFSIMPGVLYSGKGAKIDDVDATASLNYIEVPINVAYWFGQPDGGRFFIQAGPYLGYCLGGKAKIDGMDDETFKIGNDEMEDDFKALDFGVNLGLGYKLPMGLFAKAQYGLGLANILPGGDSDNSWKNSNISISVGWLFGGK
jgi:hypothetical protein